MKLIGSQKKSKHISKDNNPKEKNLREKKTAEKSSNTDDKEKKPLSSGKISRKGKWSGYSKKKKTIIITAIVICSIAFLLLSLFAIIRWEINPFYNWMFPMPGEEHLAGIRTPRPPPFNPGDPEIVPTPDDRFTDDDGEMLPLEKLRNMNVITFMVFGIEEDGNTDVIMVGAFDTEEYTIEIVSIPRDTLMNTPWDTPYYAKKANFIQPMMRREHGTAMDTYHLAMDDAVEYFEDMLGFNIDFWFTVNTRAFVSLVDAIGGVRFTVPFSFEWVDAVAGKIQISSGSQLLNGTKALAVLRQRYTPSGTNYGDLWRIENQQKFLKTAAEQILSSSNVNVVSLAEIFLRHVRTDIESEYLIRLGREFVKVKGENINFTTLPGEGVFRWEYIAIDVDEWLKIVNEKISPFYHEIIATDVSILTLDSNRKLYVTDGHWQGSSTWLPNNWQP